MVGHEYPGEGAIYNIYSRAPDVQNSGKAPKKEKYDKKCSSSTTKKGKTLPQSKYLIQGGRVEIGLPCLPT